MRLFVPDVGEELTLIDNWKFTTICEYRNQSLFDAFDVPEELRWEKTARWGDANGYDRYSPKTEGVSFEIPTDSVLKVDRVYIRKGIGEYSSLTFIILNSPDKKLVTKKHGGTAPKAVRFWVSLKETRNMDVKE